MFLKRVLYATASMLLLASAGPLGTPASASTIIYSTFGPDDTFDLSSGWTIGGTQVNVQGLQFTPAENGVVETIEIAGYRNAGGASMNVSLMADAGGQPGAVIETVPICCFGDAAAIQLAYSVLTPLLTGGTKYWLVVSAPNAGDTFGWSRNFDLPPALNAQQHLGGPWVVSYEYQGTMRLRSGTSTPTRATTWGRIKSLYR
jgi:hypothetical protein